MPGFSQFLKEKASHTAVTLESYVVINSILKSNGWGISYRQSTNLDDKSSEMATWGSVVSGSLVAEDWLKVGPRSYLPVKINGCYVLLHQSRKDGEKDVAMIDSRSAKLHWRLEVSACRERPLGARVSGTYAQVGDHHEKPAYRNLNDNAAIYFWDQRNGENLSGWWFGSIVGSPQCLALNPSQASTPPRSGWQVPPGQEVDNSIVVRDVETRSITVLGHSDPTYNGNYKLQVQALNKRPWFKKVGPLRILYCCTKGDSGKFRWNLDNREQRQETLHGVHDWSAGGYHSGGFIPLGTARWRNPSMKLTLRCDFTEDEDWLEDTNDPWKLIAPWQVWFNVQTDGPVYYHEGSNRWERDLEATGISPALAERLGRLQPEFEGACDVDMDMPPPPRRASPKEAMDPPSTPGEPYVVVSSSLDRTYVAKIHAEPQEGSSVYSGLQAGDVVELYAWDSSCTWRRVWHTLGRSMTIGVWGFVKFFNAEGRAYFRPEDWAYSAPLPFGLLGTAVWEGDNLLVRQLIKDRADVNVQALVCKSDGQPFEEASFATPLLLAGLQGHGEICVQLLRAGAVPLTEEASTTCSAVRAAGAPLPFELLGTAVWEGDCLLVRQLIKDRANVNAQARVRRSDGQLFEEASSVTPLLLAGLQGHGEICVQLLQAGAVPLTKEEIEVWSFRLQSPVGSLLRALSGEEIGNLREVDDAVDALRSDIRLAADMLLDRIAEEKCQQRRREASKWRYLEEAAQGQRAVGEKTQWEELQMETREQEKHQEKGQKKERQRGKASDTHPGLSTEESRAKVEAKLDARTKMLERRCKKRLEALQEPVDWAVSAVPVLARTKGKKDQRPPKEAASQTVPLDEFKSHRPPPREALAAPVAATSAIDSIRDGDSDYETRLRREQQELASSTQSSEDLYGVQQ